MNAETAEPRPRVSVIIPARNDESEIPDALATLPRDLHEVVIVGGGSEDAAIAAARELRPDIRVVSQAGTGRGDALATGLTECTGEVVVMFDAGAAADGAELSRFVDAMAAGVALAKGSQGVDGGSSSGPPPPGRTRNWLFCGLVNVLHTTGRMRSRLSPLWCRATVPSGGRIASEAWASPPIQVSTSCPRLPRTPLAGEATSSATGPTPRGAPPGTLRVPRAAGSRTSAWARG